MQTHHLYQCVIYACYQLAQDLDFAFLHNNVCTKQVPEYNGYMTRLCNERGISIWPATKDTYHPFINGKPQVCWMLAKAQSQPYVAWSSIFRVAAKYSVGWSKKVFPFCSLVGCTCLQLTRFTEYTRGGWHYSSVSNKISRIIQQLWL